MSDFIEVGGQDIRAELARLRSDMKRLAKDLSHFERPRSAVTSLTTDLEAQIRQQPLAAVLMGAAAGYWMLKPWTALALAAVYFARHAAPAFPGRPRRSPRNVRPSWEYWSGR